jgi:hypothetical protein
MQATPVEFIEYHYQPPVEGETCEALEFSDEFLLNFLEKVTKGHQHMEEIGQRLAGFEGRNDTLGGVTIVGDVEVSLSAMKCLLTRNRVHILPRVTVVTDDAERVLETVVGTTVARVKERCGVPAGWQGILDERPIADNYPILHDCILLFRPSVEETMAAVCGAIRARGYCAQREDDRNWIGITELRTTMTDKELRMLSEKKLRTLLRREGVRTRKPFQQRLEVHAGDWLRFLAHHARQREEVLDQASDPAEVKELTDDLKDAARLIRRINNDG